MELMCADWILCGFAVAMAVTGLFRGFSGTLAAGVALGASSALGIWLWNKSLAFIDVTWQRAALVFVVSLLAFGVVRVIVKKAVNGLLSQPTDALAGMVAGALIGVLPALAWALSGKYLDYSVIATEIARYVG